MAERKYTRRPLEQRIEDIDTQIKQLQEKAKGYESQRAAACMEFDNKIARIEARISKLEEKKKTALSPLPCGRRRKKADQVTQLIQAALNSGMSAKEISAKLGIELK